MKRKKENKDIGLKLKLGAKMTVFTTQEESELVEYLKIMEARLFGLVSEDFRWLAYQLAIKNNKSHTFNVNKQEAGRDWLRGFLKRHPDISMRVPETGFNKPVVSTFFNLLGELLDTYKFQASQIYNCDETGISSVHKCKLKVLASKGRKQVVSLTSSERGQTVTVEICMSASGIFMPPLMIFPRVRSNPDYLQNCPPGFSAEFHDWGWMQTDIFYRWLQKFIQCTNASKEHPVLLLLDSHATHTKSIALLDLARDNGVVMLCFPPHCSHRLQPLDVGIMKPISTYYDKEVTNWLRSNTPKVVTLKNIAEIFGAAFLKAASMLNAVNSFKKTGIIPFNPDVFEEVDFMAAENTNIPRKEILYEHLNLPINIEPDSAARSPDRLVEILQKLPDTISDISEINLDLDYLQPSCSHSPQINVLKTTTFENISPKDIMLFRNVSNESNSLTKRIIKKRRKTVVLTGTPYKNELIENQNQSKNKTKRINKSVKKKCQRNLFDENQPSKKKIKKLPSHTLSRDDTECLYCGYTYAESNEGWICCQDCAQWAHLSCAGKDGEGKNMSFICEKCS